MRKIAAILSLSLLTACTAKKQITTTTPTPLSILKTPGDPQMEEAREDALMTNLLVTITGLRLHYVGGRERGTVIHEWLEKKGGTEPLMKNRELEAVLTKTFEFNTKDPVQDRAVKRAGTEIRQTLADMGYKVGLGCATGCHN